MADGGIDDDRGESEGDGALGSDGVLRPDEVSAARMVASGLARDRAGTPAEAVRTVLCMQGQDLPGLLRSIALRTAGRSIREVRDAFDRGEIVRSWTQRGTVHATAAADLSGVLSVTYPRMRRQDRRRRERLGIDDDLEQRAADLAAEVIRREGPVTRTRLRAAWEGLDVDAVPGRAYHLIVTLCQQLRLVQGPFAPETAAGSAREQLFADASDWLPSGATPDPAVARAEMIVRYVGGHGPVTVHDAARWSGLTVSDCRAELQEAERRGRIARADVGGTPVWMGRGLSARLGECRDDVDRMLLLPGFDELILGYKDRSATLAPEHEALVVPGGNGVFRGTVVVGTRARGTWHRTTSRDRQVIVTEFPGERVDADAAERALAAQTAD